LFGKGFKIPVPDTFYYTLSGIEVGHKNGYLYIYATPNFEKIDLLQLFEIGITQISFSTLDLIRLLTTGTISDQLEKLMQTTQLIQKQVIPASEKPIVQSSKPARK
jgi:hypothetical protein